MRKPHLVHRWGLWRLSAFGPLGKKDHGLVADETVPGVWARYLRYIERYSYDPENKFVKSGGPTEMNEKQIRLKMNRLLGLLNITQAQCPPDALIDTMLWWAMEGALKQQAALSEIGQTLKKVKPEPGRPH